MRIEKHLRLLNYKFSQGITKTLLDKYSGTQDVTTVATGANVVAPNFSGTLTLSLPLGADSAHHRRGCS